MKLLELFSGTGSVGEVFAERGWDVISLDRDMAADIRTDIMDWNYKAYNPGDFDVIWASPPCTEYSRAKTVGIRKIDEANQVVQRTLYIIEYLQPKLYFIENPQSGLLKSQPIMRNYTSYHDVDYCKYGLPYRKRTRLWNNSLSFVPRVCNRDCGGMDEARKKHIQSAQRSPHGAMQEGDVRRRFSLVELYRIPRELVVDVVDAVSRDLDTQPLV